MRMADFSYPELLQDIGNAAAGFGKTAVNKAANFACALYAQYPGFFVPALGGGIQRGVWNNLCSGRVALPTAQPSYFGGQCPVEYDVFIGFTQFGAGNVERGVARLVGPILGVEVLEPNPQTFLGKFILVVKGAAYLGSNTGGNLSPNPNEGWAFVAGSNDSINPYSNVRILRVVRRDGLPDNCGSQSVGFPPSGPLPNGGAGVVGGTYDDGGSYSLPVIIAPSINGEVHVNVGDVCISFDMFGASACPVSADTSGLLDAFNEGINKVLEGQCACADIPNVDNYDIDDILSDDATGNDDVTGLEWVRVRITSKALNAKSQSGGAAADIFYAGWLCFIAGDSRLPREPIHYIDGIFKAPEGCTGYEYCLYQGYSATATEFKRRPTPPTVA
jgi:hypothetical protein